LSAKRQKAPTVLSPEQVKLGLTKLEFRDQLLVLLDGALATRRGELAALRWQDCDFENDTFQIEHSYYWRRGGILKSTKTEASTSEQVAKEQDRIQSDCPSVIVEDRLPIRNQEFQAIH
jgi:integrase